MKLRKQLPYKYFHNQELLPKPKRSLKQRFFNYFISRPLGFTRKLLGLTPQIYPDCIKETDKMLGQGAFGKVTLAEYKGMQVAHKSRKDPYSNDNTLPKEARLLSRLNHPHIIKCYGNPDADTLIKIREQALNKALEPADSEENAEYINIESVNEEEAGLQTELAECTLREKLTELQQTERLRLSLNILSAVSYLHRQQWCHLDIKPENLLWVNGTVKLSDFGSAQQGKKPDFIPVSDQDTVIVPGYTPPEMLTFHHNKKAAPVNGMLCDSWSLGCTLAELITGEAVFKPSDYFSENGWLLYTEEIPFQSRLNTYFRKHRKHLHPEVYRVLKQMLNPDPHKRITVQQALQSFPTPGL